MKLGIDVNGHQVPAGTAPATTPVDWQKAKLAGIEWATIRRSYTKGGTDGYGGLDPHYPLSLAGAKAAGMKSVAYHWYDPKYAREPGAQAKNFVDLLGQPDEVMLDLEDSTNILYPKAFRGIWQYLKQWLDIVQAATGKQPILYLNLNYFQSYLYNATTPYTRLPCGDYRVMWAQYTNPPGGIPYGPNVPLPWTRDLLHSWQFARADGAYYGMRWSKECALAYLYE